MANDERIARIRHAQDAFYAAQKCAGSADIVARVRQMPNGTLDVAFQRRAAMQQRLRLGSIGTHAHLAKLATALGKAAPKGHFYVITVAASDDSDAEILVAPKPPLGPRTESAEVPAAASTGRGTPSAM